MPWTCAWLLSEFCPPAVPVRTLVLPNHIRHHSIWQKIWSFICNRHGLKPNLPESWHWQHAILLDTVDQLGYSSGCVYHCKWMVNARTILGKFTFFFYRCCTHTRYIFKNHAHHTRSAGNHLWLHGGNNTQELVPTSLCKLQTPQQEKRQDLLLQHWVPEEKHPTHYAINLDLKRIHASLPNNHLTFAFQIAYLQQQRKPTHNQMKPSIS